MIDALQVFVRGFEGTERGEDIANYLTEIGFSVEDIFDGSSDSLGGLIETDDVYQDELAETDPDIILSVLRERTGFDGLWLQTREFRLAEEGEYGRDEDDERPNDGPQLCQFRVIGGD